MGLAKAVELFDLDSVQGGMSQFYTPQRSDETILVEVPGNTIENLFVHHFQTDQLLAVRGSMVLAVLYNREYHYIPLRDVAGGDRARRAHRCPQVLKIPPGIPHGAINPDSESCLLVNAVLRHGTAHPKDYQSITPPFPYNLELAYQQLYQPIR